MIFLIKSFCYMTKKLGQKSKYLQNEKSLWGEIKNNFFHFYRAFSCQNCSQTWECAFKRQPHKMVKHTQKICRQRPSNCLSVFDHFLGLALSGLNYVKGTLPKHRHILRILWSLNLKYYEHIWSWLNFTWCLF